jgi:hypothetical protein
MGWKIFFWFFSIIEAVGIIDSFTHGEMSPIHILDFLISIMASVGLFCFAYKKRCLNSNFWKIYICVFILWDLPFNIFIEHFYTSVLGCILYASLNIPLYIGLYLYAFKFFASIEKAKINKTG